MEESAFVGKCLPEKPVLEGPARPSRGAVGPAERKGPEGRVRVGGVSATQRETEAGWNEVLWSLCGK